MEKRPIVLDQFGGKQLIQTGDYIGITAGGTGAVTAAGARTALGLAIGSDVQGYSAALAAIIALAGNGQVVKTGANTYAVRSLQQPAAGITVSNGDGVAGNPTIGLADDLAAVEGLASAGFAVRTGNSTWAIRNFTVVSNTRLTVTNGDGIAGDAQFDLAQVADGGGGALLKFSRDAYGRVTGTSGVVAGDLTALLNTVYVKQAGDSMSGYLTLFDDPVNPLHAATKQYVDNHIQGLDTKQTAAVATTGPLPSYAYNNGVTGVGATITLTANGVLTVDGYNSKINDIILVKDEVDQTKNGLYKVTTEGTATSKAVLTRTTDMDKYDEFSGAFVPVSSIGNANKNSLWLANPVGAVTVGATAIPFTQLNGATSLLEGSGISITGNTIAVRLSPRLTFNGQQIDLVTLVPGGGAGTKITYDQWGRVTGSSNATAADVGAQPASNELSGIALISTTGMVARTAAGMYVPRTLQQPASGLTITNPDGVAGNPTVALANDLAAVEGLAGTGLAVRTGPDTWATRQIAVAARLAITDAGGVAGNPTIDLAGGVVAPGTYEQVTVDQYGRVVAGSNNTAAQPDISNLTNNESVTVSTVNAVYTDGTGTFRKAISNSSSLSQAIGFTKAPILAANVGQVQTAGEISATTNEWDQVTGQTGGLTPGAIYFLDNVTTGHITSTVPGSGYLLQLGQAISTTKLVIRIGERIQL